MFFWNRREGEALCCRTLGDPTLRSLCEKAPLELCRARSRTPDPRSRARTPRKSYGPVSGGGICFRAPRWSCSLTLLPFPLRAPDATPSTLPTMPTVTWALMPSSKWTLKPVTSPGAFWRSETWQLRLGSANTQVGRVEQGGL